MQFDGMINFSLAKAFFSVMSIDDPPQEALNKVMERINDLYNDPQISKVIKEGQRTAWSTFLDKTDRYRKRAQASKSTNRKK